MSKYQVISPIKTPGGIVTGGYIEVADKEVEELTRAGVIGEQEPSATTPPPDRAAAILAAIAQLSTADATLWLTDGRPNAGAIAAITGWSVSAAERDAAWSSLIS